MSHDARALLEEFKSLCECEKVIRAFDLYKILQNLPKNEVKEINKEAKVEEDKQRSNILKIVRN